MVMVNWDNIQENEYELLPDGNYPVRVQNVAEKEAKTGTPYWDIEFVITDGAYAGRKLWDKLFFTDKSMNRVKFVAHRLGIDTTGEVDFRPSALTNRTCVITVLTEEYKDNNDNTKARNVVPFDGYAVDGFTTKGVEKKNIDPKDDLPF